MCIDGIKDMHDDVLDGIAYLEALAVLVSHIYI